MATRREVLGRAALALGVLACRGAVGQPAERAAYVAVETSAATGLSRARLLTGDGAPAGSVPLDLRAHGMARHGATLAVFPRRPGTRLALVDLGTLEVVRVIEAPEGRRFNGHGAFSLDGRTLLVTENDLDALDGWVGVYEIGAGARRLGSIPLPGPGPHDIRAAGGGRFHVALGGLRTHPDYGRTPLNLADFTSGLALLDPAAGVAEGTGPWPGAEGVSLRHLAEDGTGRLYVGGQLADPARGAGRPVLWAVEDGRPRSLDPEGRLGGYVSSVAARGSAALATSKETGAVLRFEDGVPREVHRIDGASAAALGPDLSVVSGHAELAVGPVALGVAEGHEFDNHGLTLV